MGPVGPIGHMGNEVALQVSANRPVVVGLSHRSHPPSLKNPPKKPLPIGSGFAKSTCNKQLLDLAMKRVTPQVRIVLFLLKPALLQLLVAG